MKKKKHSIWIILATICILHEIVYFIFSNMLSSEGLYFRAVIKQAMFLNKCIIGICIVVPIFNSTFESSENDIEQIVSSCFVLGISLFIMFLVFMPYLFDESMEGETYIDSTRYIVVSHSHGLHHTNLYYYEYVNEIIMKKSDKESEMIDGCYNPYATY